MGQSSGEIQGGDGKGKNRVCPSNLRDSFSPLPPVLPVAPPVPATLGLSHSQGEAVSLSPAQILRVPWSPVCRTGFTAPGWSRPRTPLIGPVSPLDMVPCPVTATWTLASIRRTGPRWPSVPPWTPVRCFFTRRGCWPAFRTRHPHSGRPRRGGPWLASTGRRRPVGSAAHR